MTGIKIDTIYSGPWGRVQKEASSGQIDMIAGAFHTAERVKYMDYLYPAFQMTRPSIWLNSGSNKLYTEWSDLKSEVGISVINNSFGQVFDTYAKQHLNIGQVASVEQALKMLASNRIDYFVYEENSAKAYANKLGILHLKISPIEIERAGLFLTLSKKSACNTPALREKMGQALKLLTTEKNMAYYLSQAHQDWAAK